ncbi:MAG: hypothetical protein DMG94_06605 [Acidobacteria bacterium]|nr:MAG: hypothetical protein DMG94_06605 [Acidobacteriota bacterium]
MQQTWNDLLFAHWPIAPESLRPLIPVILPLDTFNGQCWIAVTPFHMTGVRGRWLPPIPALSSFPELNVRTYVNYGGKPGVFFFSLDAASRAAVWGARTTYHLPYFYSLMKVSEASLQGRPYTDASIQYDCFRDSSTKFRAKYGPVGPVRLRESIYGFPRQGLSGGNSSCAMAPAGC